MHASVTAPSPVAPRLTLVPRSGKALAGWIVNGLLYALSCTMVGTGGLLRWRLPPGSRGGRGLRFLGLGRHDWADIHTYLGYALIGLVAVHLALHWAWLYRVAAQRYPWRLVIGLGSGVAAICFFLLWPL